MAYTVKLGSVVFPVPPPKIEIKGANQNKTETLINGDHYTVLKKAGLRTITFTVMLPTVPFPFAHYEDGFVPATDYIAAVEAMKDIKWPVTLRISRTGSMLAETEMKVSIETYTVREDVALGQALELALELKEYSGKKTALILDTEVGRKRVERIKRLDDKVVPREIVVRKGDTLWNIAKKYLGDGALYTSIHQLNKNTVKNPNKIQTGQTLKLPERR